MWITSKKYIQRYAIKTGKENMNYSHRPAKQAPPRKGTILLETIFVLIVAVIAISAGSYFLSEHAKQQTARATADHLIQLTSSFQKYLKDNYAELAKEVAVYKHIDLNELTKEGSEYLPRDFKNMNAYGQEYVLSVKKNGENALQGMIYSRGGEIIPPDQGLRIAQLIGFSGGYTVASDPSTVKSNLEGYYADLTQYGGGAAEGGKLVSGVFMSDGAIVYENYLYRNKVEGRPELNEMKTDLYMGEGAEANSWDINAVKNLNVNVNVIIGNDAEVDRDVTIGQNANVTRNVRVGGNANVDKNLSVGGNIDVAGNMTVTGYVQGKKGVRSLKEGVVGGSCSGGDIGYQPTLNTTLFCRSGKWITTDYALGHSDGHHRGVWAPKFYETKNINTADGMVRNRTIWCTEPTSTMYEAGLIGVQGGTYFHYDRATDRGTLHPDCRPFSLALTTDRSDHAIWSEAVAHSDRAGRVEAPSIIEHHIHTITTVYVQRPPPPPKDDD